MVTLQAKKKKTGGGGAKAKRLAREAKALAAAQGGGDNQDVDMDAPATPADADDDESDEESEEDEKVSSHALLFPSIPLTYSGAPLHLRRPAVKEGWMSNRESALVRTRHWFPHSFDITP
jgi:hypothetical protein